MKVIDLEQAREKYAHASGKCSARLAMLLYYVKPSKLEEVTEKILMIAKDLVEKNIDRSKEKDFRAGKNPFIY